jgi:hypothetical protein
VENKRLSAVLAQVKEMQDSQPPVIFRRRLHGTPRSR